MRKVIRICSMGIVLAVCNLAAVAHADVVTEWNQIMLDAFRQAGVSPLVGMRGAAIVHASMYDAINGIERRYAPVRVKPRGPRAASPRAAAIQAAYVSLVNLFNTQQEAFNAKRIASLTALLKDEQYRSVVNGIEWGQTVAEEIWTWRSSDGFNTQSPPFIGGTEPGQWRPTPPAFAPMALPHLGSVTPWAIDSADDFPAKGRPSLTSDEYTRNFNEVRRVGSLDSASRSSDQTLLARFWASAQPNYFWDRVAITLAEKRHMSLLKKARLLAMINIAMADTNIVAWKGKRDFNFWRPITAIRLADQDGNPATSSDPNWTPLLGTPPYPDYPSGLCSVSAAAIAVLARHFGNRTSFVVESDGLPGVVRFFPDFDAANAELVDARVFSGIHFRFADADAVEIGTSVARHIMRNSFHRLHGQQ